jgi:hypothetical protein
LVVAVLLIVGVGALIARAAGFAEVKDAIEHADSTWFVVCLAMQVAALAGYAAVVREAVRWDDGPDPRFGLSAHVMLASIGATRVFAAGGAGALASTYWCFRRARFDQREALVRVLGFNSLFYVAFGVGAWIAAWLLALGIWGHAPIALTVPWLVAIPFCFAAAIVVTALAGFARTYFLAIVNRPLLRGFCRIPRARDPCCGRSSTGVGTSRACGQRSTPSASPCRFRSWSLHSPRGTLRRFSRSRSEVSGESMPR